MAQERFVSFLGLKSEELNDFWTIKWKVGQQEYIKVPLNHLISNKYNTYLSFINSNHYEKGSILSVYQFKIFVLNEGALKKKNIEESTLI